MPEKDNDDDDNDDDDHHGDDDYYVFSSSQRVSNTIGTKLSFKIRAILSPKNNNS